MKITKTQLKQLIKEEMKTLLQELDFDTDTGLPVTAAGVKKCIQDSECLKRLTQATRGNAFDKFDDFLGRELSSVIIGAIYGGNFREIQNEAVRYKMIATMNRIASGKPPSIEAAPEAGGGGAGGAAGDPSAERQITQGIERTKAAMKKVLANPDLTPEEREEEKRDFEEDLRDLQDELQKLRGK
jgi:hypothetical protein